MTRAKLYLAIQAGLCVPLVVLLSVSAVGIYREGMARRADNPRAAIYRTTRRPTCRRRGYAMPFATDAHDAMVAIMGDTGTLPQTVVLNRRGEVVYNTNGSVTPELLDALYEEANG